MRNEVLDTVRESFRVLFLLQVPLLVAGVLAGGVSAIIQMVTSLQDSTVGYVLKVVACVAVVGAMFTSYLSALKELMFMALQ
jgi:type III secretory pathway component EscS